jgi:hypothetical protein
MSEFNFTRDFKFIDWKATILLALYRGISAGIVWMILMLLSGSEGSIGTILSAPIILPIGYLLFFLPLGYVTATLSRTGVPYIGLISIVCSLLVVVGDPLLWAISKTAYGKYIPAGDIKFLGSS